MMKRSSYPEIRASSLRSRLSSQRSLQNRSGWLFLLGKASEGFKKQADFHYKMKEKQLRSSLYDESWTLGDGSVIIRPPS